jgi:hypothetical protein
MVVVVRVVRLPTPEERPMLAARRPPLSRSSFRLGAAAVGLTIFAVACASASDPGPEAGSAAEGEDEALFSPTSVDAPFDLAGGATSSTEGRLDPTSPDRTPLAGNVAEATEPWATDWSLRTVELDEFLAGLSGVDPRDRIVPLDTPTFEPIGEATWLDDREPGALVQLDGEVRFYPLSILTLHEIVNDRFGDVPVAVTYAPVRRLRVAAQQ